MAGDNGKIKVKSPARQLADIAAEYFRPSGVPKSYANDAVEVHAVNLERRLTEAVDELITSRDFVIGELVKALEAVWAGVPDRVRAALDSDIPSVRNSSIVMIPMLPETLRLLKSALTAAGRKP